MNYKQIADQNLKLLKGELLTEYKYVDIPPQNIKPHNLPNWTHPGLVYTSPGVISQPVQKPGIGGGVGLGAYYPYVQQLFRELLNRNFQGNYYG